MLGPARSRRWSRVGTSALLGSLACCTWACGTSGPAGLRPHGSAVSVPLLGHFPLSAGSLRLGGRCRNRDVPTPAGNLRSLDCAQLRQGPKLPVLLPADVGFGMILTHPLTHSTSWQWCRAPTRNCSGVGWAELAKHRVQTPGKGGVISCFESAGAWGDGGHTRAACL